MAAFHYVRFLNLGWWSMEMMSWHLAIPEHCGNRVVKGRSYRGERQRSIPLLQTWTHDSKYSRIRFFKAIPAFFLPLAPSYRRKRFFSALPCAVPDQVWQGSDSQMCRQKRKSGFCPTGKVTGGNFGAFEPGSVPYLAEFGRCSLRTQILQR